MKLDVKTINRRYKNRKRLEAFKTILNRKKRIAEKLEAGTRKAQRYDS